MMAYEWAVEISSTQKEDLPLENGESGMYFYLFLHCEIYVVICEIGFVTTQ